MHGKHMWKTDARQENEKDSSHAIGFPNVEVIKSPEK